MSQTKQMSFIEACINTFIGYCINIIAQLILFPIFNIHIAIHEHLLMGCVFTLISIVRSYYIRRLFNYLQLQTA